MSGSDHLSKLSVVDLVNYAYWLELQMIGRQNPKDTTPCAPAAEDARQAMDPNELFYHRMKLLERHRATQQ